MKTRESNELKDVIYAHRRKEYEDHKKNREASGKWNASLLGACPRKHTLKRLQATITNPPTMEGLGKMKMGIKHEESLVEEMDAAGLKIKTGDQEAVESDIVIGMLDSSTEDGRPIEIKSQQSRSFWHKAKGKEDDGNVPVSKGHEYQLLFYMMMKKQNKGKFMYVSKDDSTIMELDVSATEEDFDQLRDRIKMLEDSWQKKILPPAIPEEKWECNAKWCNYYTLCKLIGEHSCPHSKIKVAEEEFGKLKENEDAT